MNTAKLVHKFRLAITGLIFLAAGCTVGPNYQKPDLPVPAGWTGSATERRRCALRRACPVVEHV